MVIESFTEIESWKLARSLVNEIYKITANDKLKRDYGPKDQLQRASVPIMSNIAEGFEGGSNKVFINFLNCSYRPA